MVSPQLDSAAAIDARVVVDRFRGEYFFLSNVSPAPTPHRGHVYPTSEHAYMAARIADNAAILAIRSTADPLEALRIGRAANPIDDWRQRRFAIMEDVVTAKFAHNPNLAAKLAATSDAKLVEGNNWHDQYWGSCRCHEHRDTPGANHLGTILMTVQRHIASS